MELGENLTDIDKALASTMGEGRFGQGHWHLSVPKRVYYLLKPFLPRSLTKVLRIVYSRSGDHQERANWPVDSRYVSFLWEVMRQVLLSAGLHSVAYRSLWPEGRRFAFVLTHDIETAEGQGLVRKIADIEEGLGLRSSFNFVLERYKLDHGVIQDLRNRGFEIGCHGLKHDGKLYSSKRVFENRASRINALLPVYGMVGFRSPLTHRNPEWLQQLEIEYDSSFFDTDPFEPIPGGTMSIWPFFLGRFVELPYTLVQDYTLVNVLGETTPRIWLDKVGFIKKYRGMALLNSHPDYLKEDNALKIYTEFLHAMKDAEGYWHALPRNVAEWWRARSSPVTALGDLPASTVALDENGSLYID